MNQANSSGVLREFNVATAQASPVFFRREACVEKVVRLIGEAAAGDGDVKLVVFPEAMIPGYPRGFHFGCAVGGRSEEGRRLWRIYYENSIEIPGPETERMGEAAQQAGVYVAVGVTEKTRLNGSLYCSLLILGPDGRILHKHRKIKPTAAERVIWAEGGAAGLNVVESSIGRMGGLICWENYMPLARMALYNQGIQLYLAPTADSRESWTSSMIHIACESRCFLFGCNQFFTKDMIPRELPCYHEIREQPGVMCRGGSVSVSPLGKILSGPLWDREGILFTRVDLAEIVHSRFDFDPSGHYQRPDLFRFNVNEPPSSE